MTDNMHLTILRRMTGQRAEEADDNPLTSSRALRLALTKAANDTVGLILTVTSIEEETLPLDAMLDGLDQTLMLIELVRSKQLVGLVGLDTQLRAAILEMQTVGNLIDAAAEERPATATDKMMCDPVLHAFLKDLPQAVMGTEFEGWPDDIMVDQRLQNARAAGLVLDDRDYRILRLTVDLGVADRTGSVLIALPPVPTAGQMQPDIVEHQNWDSQFRANVSAAPAMLEALLHRFTMPLAQAQNLQVGQVVPLPGCTVNSVRLLTPDGLKVAEAKLGQVGGKRAVRIEAAPVPEMAEIAAAGSLGLSEMMIDESDQLSLDAGGLMDTGLHDAAAPDEPLPANMPLDDGPDLMADTDFPMMDVEGLSLNEEG